MTNRYRIIHVDVKSLIGVDDSMPDQSDLNPDYVESGRRIKDRRQHLGFTQAALARTIGVAQSSLADWERGRTRPRPAALLRLATALRIFSSDLIPEMAISKEQYIEAAMPKSRPKTRENYVLTEQFLEDKIDRDNSDQLYLRLFALCMKLYDDIEKTSEAKKWIELGSDYSHAAQVRRGVLLCKWLWESTKLSDRVDENGVPLPDALFARFDEYRREIMHFYDIGKTAESS